MSGGRERSLTSSHSSACSSAHTLPPLAVPFSQDLPPQGGYEPIRYKRNLPARGPGGLVVFGAVLGICGYGFYRVAIGNLEQR